MAFAGLKKQFNKANQYVSEKVGGAEGTKLDEEFIEMEKRTDITYDLVDEIQTKTREFLQPNPASRAKMAAVKGISKLSGQAKASTYPQPEGVLGDCMHLHGRKLGDDTIFGQALMETGETLKQMADVKYSLDDNVKQNFLEPLHHLQTKDLKEVQFHRKKLQGRRLDFDCKKRKASKGAGTTLTEEEIRLAEEKFGESLHLAHLGMHNLLENDAEQVSQLSSFAESLYEYHKQCADILKHLVESLKEKKHEAARRPKRNFVAKSNTFQNQRMSEHDFTFFDHNNDGRNSNRSSGSFGRNNNNNGGPPPPYSSGNTSPFESYPTSAPAQPVAPAMSAIRMPVLQQPKNTMQQQPCCKALYDFDPENPGELGFKEGNIITLINRIDENWYEGSINGRGGYFPVSYVQIIIPLNR